MADRPARRKGPPVKGGTLNWYLSGNPPTLDPTQNVSTLSLTPASAVYSRLFRNKASFDVLTSLNLDSAPDLAMSAESSDAVTWTLKLRPNAKFQNIPPVNGHAVEAEDVKQSFLKATGQASVNAGNLNFVDPNQIQTPDKQTVVFKLNYPFSLFPVSGLASRFYSWIFPREVVGGGFDHGQTDDRQRALDAGFGHARRASRSTNAIPITTSRVNRTSTRCAWRSCRMPTRGSHSSPADTPTI